jgi:hypothetical protein
VLGNLARIIPRDVVLIGVPTNSRGTADGVARAPGVLRQRRPGGGRFPLLIGGDCPVILGALAALQDGAGGPGLLFVDGHEDAWPPRASPAGERPIASPGWRCGCSTTASAPGRAPSCPGSAPGTSSQQLGQLTSAALATPGCAGWSVCIYNPDLDPGRDGADAIIGYLTQAVTGAGPRRPPG